MNLNPGVHLTLSVLQVNQLLAIIAKEPLGQVIDLFSTIKAQGDMALLAIQADDRKPATNGVEAPAPAPEANGAAE